MSPRRLCVFALLLMNACAARGAEPADDAWRDLATAARESPARAGAGDLAMRWTGADGRPVSITVAAPRNPARKIVTLTPGNDDTGAIAEALGQLRAAGGGTLKLQPGTYQFANAGTQPGVMLDGLSDVLIDATGARFMLAQWGRGIVIRNSARITIRGLSIGFARPAVVGATVHQAGGQTSLDFGGGPAAGTTFYQISRLDAQAARYADGPSRLLFGAKGLSGNRTPGGRVGIADPQLATLKDGDRVAVKLSYYQGAAIDIDDPGNTPRSADIILDHVAIRDSAGMGLQVSRMARGLAVIDSTFGADGPGVATIAFDALHLGAAAGDILIRGNHFARSGDDAINLASPIFAATIAADGRTARIAPRGGGADKGAKLAFFDDQLAYVGTGQATDRSPVDAGGIATVHLDAPIATPERVRFARDLALIGSRYAVVDNVIGHCECHGILVQGPNGLVSGNHILDTRFNAIRIVTSAFWKEGAGAQNLVVQNNEIARSGDDGRRGVVWAAIAIYGELVGDQPYVGRQEIHSSISVHDNTISDVAQGCISVASARNVTIGQNGCARFNQELDRGRLLIEREGVVAGAQRFATKTAYLARGDGIWIDPLSTANVAIAKTAR